MPGAKLAITAADLPRLSSNLHDILGKVENHNHVSNWPVNHAQELDQLLQSGQLVLALPAAPAAAAAADPAAA